MEEWGEFGSACSVTTPTIPVSGLSPALCGSTFTSLSRNLTPITVLLATQYEWEITDVATEEISIRIVSRNLNLNTASIPGYGYAKTYSIRIRAFIGNSSTWGPFGSACTVTTPPIPASGLSLAQCGITMTSLTQTLSPITVPSATQYEWEITDAATDAISNRIVTRTINLNTSGIPGYGYNKSYSIRVRAFAGDWGPFGSACIITTPAIPVSGLVASQCGITMTSLTQTLSPITVLNATQYEWEITDVATLLVTNATVTRTLKLSTAGIPGYGIGKTYSIRIRAFAGAWGQFGSVCNVTTPAPPRMAVNQEVDESMEQQLTETTSLALFPNPGSGKFRIRTNAGNEITVTDLLGHELIRTNMETNELSLDLSPLPNGVYIVRVGKEMVRVVKM